MRIETILRPLLHRRQLAAVLAFVAAVAACDSPTDSPISASLEALASSVQSGEAGTAVAASPAVRLVDQRGRPVTGEAVTFEIVSGGGGLVTTGAPVQAVTVETDATGRATVTEWRLGASAGLNEVRASVSGLAPVPFTATGLAGPAARIETSGWTRPEGRVGEELAVLPAVRVTDENGNPVVGATVVFAAVGGAVSGAAATTNSGGIAVAGIWTLGPVAGEQSLHASAGTLIVDLIAVAAPGPAAVLEIGGGNAQTATVATTVALAPTVVVRDVFGNRVGGVTVSFDVVGGGGTISGAQGGVLAANSLMQNADALGTASVAQWTLGPRAGSNQLRATLSGVVGAAVTFDAQGVAATPASLRVFAGDNQTASAGSAVAVGPAVFVTDVHGNAVTNAPVTFAVSSGGGSVAGGETTTNGAGVAVAGAWFLGGPGANTLQASSPGLAAVTFLATAVSGPGGSGGTGGGYQVEIRFTGSVAGSLQTILDAAAGRWTRAITGDLPSVPMSVAAGACGVPHPAVNEVVDDLIIFVAIAPIDGPGKVLGSAGPCFIRSGGLPVIGVMFMDAADISQMQANGTLESVVAHEIGHVLGVGTMWNGLIAGSGSTDPYFVGGSAVAAFLASGGSTYPGNPVPVENTGGPGTRESHWRESVFGAELMTGWINGANAPLSSVTLASLIDLGYAVNLNLAGGFALGDGLAAQGADTGPGIELREGPPLVTPITVDSRGRRMVPVQR
jgi:hypothetical protein